jgi:hypothetical protein
MKSEPGAVATGSSFHFAACAKRSTRPLLQAVLTQQSRIPVPFVLHMLYMT